MPFLGLTFPWETQPLVWPELTLEQIVRRARLLVIDDTEFLYLELFQRDGYAIEKWSDVTDLARLERGEFDVILLDIHGVGTALSSDQGLGVLRHLKTVRPAQIVIAYSNATWTVGQQEFFDHADARLNKTGDYVDFKRTVDDLLRKHFSLGFHVDRIIRTLGPVPGDSQEVRALVTSAILTQRTSQVEKAAGRWEIDPERLNLILQLTQTAIGLLSLQLAR